MPNLNYKLKNFIPTLCAITAIITFFGHDYFNIIGEKQPEFPMNIIYWILPFAKVLFALLIGYCARIVISNSIELKEIQKELKLLNSSISTKEEEEEESIKAEKLNRGNQNELEVLKSSIEKVKSDNIIELKKVQTYLDEKIDQIENPYLVQIVTTQYEVDFLKIWIKSLYQRLINSRLSVPNGKSIEPFVLQAINEDLEAIKIYNRDVFNEMSVEMLDKMFKNFHELKLSRNELNPNIRKVSN